MRRAGEVCYVDAHNRMGRGRGEVCFGSREVMHKAKEELNGYDINGKRIEIIIKVCKLFLTISRDPRTKTGPRRRVSVLVPEI